MSNQDNSPIQPNEPAASVSRRGFLKLAGVSGLATAAGGLAAARAAASNPDGTPEQVHLTWGNDPTSEVVISWASLASAVNPRARIVADGALAARDLDWRMRHSLDAMVASAVRSARSG